MFELFGEMTAEEINELARNLKTEGDTANVITLAKENGIDTDMAEVFLEGEIDFLCDNVTAAIGKIEMEAKEMKVKEIIADWVGYIKVKCFDDEEMALAVREKDKNLEGCIAELLKWSFKDMYEIDKKICKAADIKGAAYVKMGIPGMAKAKELIESYYRG